MGQIITLQVLGNHQWFRTTCIADIDSHIYRTIFLGLMVSAELKCASTYPIATPVTQIHIALVRKSHNEASRAPVCPTAKVNDHVKETSTVSSS
jgi:hypothetical protein